MRKVALFVAVMFAVVFSFVPSMAPVAHAADEPMITVHAVTGSTGDVVLIPVTVENLPEGVISFDFIYEYNPNVLEFDGFDFSGDRVHAGNGNPYWNVVTPGLVRFAYADHLPFGSEGLLVNLRFIVVGNQGESSYLTILEPMFNEDIIPAWSSTSFQVVNPGGIQGTVRYCGNDRYPSVGVDVQFDNSSGIVTDQNGQYQWEVSAGIHNMKLSKPFDPYDLNAITAYDGAQVLRCKVGLISCNLDAADASGDGILTAYDAGIILRHSVGIYEAFPNELGKFKYSPNDHNVDVAPGRVEFVDFIERQVGDVSCNRGEQLLSASSADSTSISVSGQALEDENFIVDLKSTKGSFISFETAFDFNHGGFESFSVSDGWTVESILNEEVLLIKGIRMDPVTEVSFEFGLSEPKPFKLKTVRFDERPIVVLNYEYNPVPPTDVIKNPTEILFLPSVAR